MEDKIQRDSKGRFIKGTTPWFKDQKMSEETKKKISNANHGNTHSQKTKDKIGQNKNRNRKISESRKGIIFSKEHRKNLSKSLKGKTKKPFTRNIRINMSLAHTKEKTFNGFKASLNKRIRVNSKYLKWRADVFKRDNYHCQHCGEKGYLEAHHIIPYSKIVFEFKIRTLKQAMNCKLFWDVGNGISYCRKCHIKLDKNIGRKIYARIK